jgi:restriction system protein
MFVIGSAISGVKSLRRSRLLQRQSSIETIRALSWQDFESFVCAAFEQEGYQATLSRQGADGGVDIVLRNGDTKLLVQCKQWRTNQVSVREVRELHGVVAAEHASGGVFVCSGDYSPAARDFAKQIGMRLIDGSDLVHWILEPEAQPAFDRSTTACPQCDGTLVKRTARRGANSGQQFFGCENYPRCRFTKTIG